MIFFNPQVNKVHITQPNLALQKATSCKVTCKIKGRVKKKTLSIIAKAKNSLSINEEDFFPVLLANLLCVYL